MMKATPSYGVIGPERAELKLLDAVTLVADVWRPDGPGRFPVLLMRQPYGRAIASTIVFACARRSSDSAATIACSGARIMQVAP